MKIILREEKKKKAGERRVKIAKVNFYIRHKTQKEIFFLQTDLSKNHARISKFVPIRINYHYYYYYYCINNISPNKLHKLAF